MLPNVERTPCFQLCIVQGVVADIVRPVYMWRKIRWIREVHLHRRAALRPSCPTLLFMNEQGRGVVCWESSGSSGAWIERRFSDRIAFEIATDWLVISNHGRCIQSPTGIGLARDVDSTQTSHNSIGSQRPLELVPPPWQVFPH